MDISLCMRGGQTGAAGDEETRALTPAQQLRELLKDQGVAGCGVHVGNSNTACKPRTDHGTAPPSKKLLGVRKAGVTKTKVRRGQGGPQVTPSRLQVRLDRGDVRKDKMLGRPFSAAYEPMHKKRGNCIEFFCFACVFEGCCYGIIETLCTGPSQTQPDFNARCCVWLGFASVSADLTYLPWVWIWRGTTCNGSFNFKN